MPRSSFVYFVLISIVLFAALTSRTHAHAFPRAISVIEDGIKPLSITVDEDTELVVENTTKEVKKFVFISDRDTSRAAELSPKTLQPGEEWYPDILVGDHWTYYSLSNPLLKGSFSIDRIPDIDTTADIVREQGFFSRILVWVKSWLYPISNGK